MTLFRIILMAMLVLLAGYTAITISNHGWNLLPVFFADMAKMAWPGQFNLDFMMMLFLSANWVAWRHRYTARGLGLALLAFFGGAVFLTIYLLVITGQAKGDMRQILMGNRSS